ncbi:alpha/beta fold hydrolase [Paenibacillus senegalensis]|uniref:alpha/beta fold hydrolase n=1 Tax=Paenibacillus senegalensis TaxID=1465766 RepID=UPI000289EFF7|nr:alpha/beta hydrolase [Paenibacillus senegalensis]
MAYFTSNGTKLYYEVSGEGEPIIFTHGASWNHRQWEEQVACFQDKYQVVTWDVRGHGHSTLPEGKVDSEDFSRDLAALMDHLRLPKANLVGLSMGGHISLQTAIRYPDKVSRLVLIGTPCSNSFNWYERLFVPINRFSSRWLPVKTSASLQAKMLSKNNPANYAYIFKAFSMIPHDNLIRIWSAVTRMESKHDLHRVKCPTLLLIGDQDTMTNYQQEHMRKQIADAELKVIPNAHHATNLDNPAAVNEAIQAFIRNK